MLQAGAVIEFDTFGHEAYLARDHRWVTDLARLTALSKLIEDGYANQLTLGCDVWTKGALRRYGGLGYEHLFRRVIPALRVRWGVSQADLTQMLVTTPRRLLDRGRGQ